MMLTSLPSGGPDSVPVTDPPGTLLISGAEGIEITVKAAEGTVIGVPYYWQSGVWQPLLGDATVAPRQVKAGDVSLNAMTPFACFVISNPAMSGQVLTIEDIQIPSEAGSCEWEVRRYNGIPSASGTAANANLWKTDTTQSAPTFGAKYATVGMRRSTTPSEDASRKATRHSRRPASRWRATFRSP